jgi:hypothetical protein
MAYIPPMRDAHGWGTRAGVAAILHLRVEMWGAGLCGSQGLVRRRPGRPVKSFVFVVSST